MKTDCFASGKVETAWGRGRTSASCQMHSRTYCIEKSVSMPHATSRCFQQLWKTYASLKKGLRSIFQIPLQCSKPRGLDLLQCRLKQIFVMRFDSEAYFLTALYVRGFECTYQSRGSRKIPVQSELMGIRRNIYSRLFTCIHEPGC